MEVLRDSPRHLTAHIDDPQRPDYLRVRWPEGESVLALGSWHVVDGHEALPDEVRAWVQANEPYLRRWSSIVHMGFQLRKAS